MTHRHHPRKEPEPLDPNQSQPSTIKEPRAKAGGGSWAFAARFAAGILLLWLVLSHSNPARVFSRAGSVGWEAFIAGFFLILAGALPGTWAWQILCRARKVQVSFWELLRLNYVGFFFNSYLPTGVGGHLWRGYALAKSTGRTWPAITATVLERVSAFASILLLGIISLGVNQRLFFNAGIFIPVAGFMGLILLSFAGGLLLLPRLVKSVGEGEKFLGMPKQELEILASSWRENLPVLSRATAITTLSQFTEVGAYWIILQKVAPSTELLPLLTLVPMLRFINHVPLSWNSLGTQDLAMVLFWGPLGLGREGALSVSILMHGLRLLTGSVGGILYVARGHGERQDRKQEPEA